LKGPVGDLAGGAVPGLAPSGPCGPLHRTHTKHSPCRRGGDDACDSRPEPAGVRCTRRHRLTRSIAMRKRPQRRGIAPRPP